MSIEDLDNLLRTTLDDARPFAREIFREPWDAADLQSFVNRTGTATVATVGPSGWPHAAPVPVACADGDIYVVGSPGSVFLRNVAHSPSIAFSVVAKGGAVFGQGYAQKVPATPTLRTVFAHLLPTPDGDQSASETWHWEVVELKLRRLFTG